MPTSILTFYVFSCRRQSSLFKLTCFLLQPRIQRVFARDGRWRVVRGRARHRSREPGDDQGREREHSGTLRAGRQSREFVAAAGVRWMLKFIPRHRRVVGNPGHGRLELLTVAVSRAPLKLPEILASAGKFFKLLQREHIGIENRR